MPLVEQELFTLPELLSSPRFSVVRFVGSFVFRVMFCRSLCPFVVFHLAIVLSVRLLFMASNYHFGIFKFQTTSNAIGHKLYLLYH